MTDGLLLVSQTLPTDQAGMDVPGSLGGQYTRSGAARPQWSVKGAGCVRLSETMITTTCFHYTALHRIAPPFGVQNPP